MATYPMTPVDAAWYRIDGPVNFATITSIFHTRERLDFERVRTVYRERLACFDRFSQRVVESAIPFSRPQWEDIRGFDIGEQLHHIALPEPRDRTALVDLVSDLAATPLDRARPLWQVHVVDGVGEGSALIMRCHHCMGDGTAMVAVGRQLFDTAPDTPPRAAVQPNGPSPDETLHARLGTVDRLFAAGFDALEGAAKAVRASLGTALEAARNPQQAFEKARFALDGAGMLLDELLRPSDAASPLKGRFGMRKRVAWSQPVALADVKAIGAPWGATINDVLVAATTGALRAYLRRRGVDVGRADVHAMVPVDLRPPERALELGNDFGLVVLELAVRQRTRLARLRATKASMDALKRSPEAIAIRALFDVFGRGPKPVEDLAVDLFGSKASLVLTNVAGPRETLHMAGVPIERIMFWVPHPGRQLGMGVSILSYRGSATLSVIADAHRVPDPESITAAFDREFREMRKAAGRGAGRTGGR